MISGKTTLIAHLGFPTEAFKAPLIYNPYFEKAGIDAVVVPMGVKPEDYATFLRSLFRLSNIRGAPLIDPRYRPFFCSTNARPPWRLRARATRFCAARTERCSATCSTAPDFRAA